MSETNPARLATVKEACAYAKMGHTKLYEKINTGIIVAFRREGRTLVDLNSVDAMNASTLEPWSPGKRGRKGATVGATRKAPKDKTL